MNNHNTYDYKQRQQIKQLGWFGYEKIYSFYIMDTGRHRGYIFPDAQLTTKMCLWIHDIQRVDK